MRDITVLVLLLVPLGSAAADAPGPPQNLTLVNRTCHSITFQWSPPDDTGRLGVTGYDILHNGTQVVTITGTVYTLEGLTPDTVHTISVRTRNANGLSELERTLINATTQRHSVQGKVTAISGSSERLILKHSEAHVTYRCLLSAEGGREPVSVNVTSGTVTVNTHPDTAYNITCLGYDNQERDLCLEQEMSIISPPSKVEGVMFGNNIVKNGRIHQEVKWKVPVLRYNAMPQYLIRYADSEGSVKNRLSSKFEFSSEPNVTLQLTFGSSNITYYVVVAVTHKGEQVRGDFSDIVSTTYTTPGPPQDLTLVNRTCHSITFQWSPPDDTGRLDLTGYDILHNGTPVANITGTVYTLEGLTPDTVHTISVRTRNAIGPSVLWRTLTTAIEGRLQQQVTADSVSSRNLTLRHEAQVTYRCLLSAQGLEPVSVNVTSGETVTVIVLPDTMYTVGCVGYGEQRQDLCVEGNTTITTRPPKVKNVIFGRTKVVHNVIWQDISWSTVQLQNDVTKFLIKSDSSPKMATALPIAQSNTASYTLKLNVPTSNTTFTVWVAATRNRALRDHGDFSDPQSITYTTPGLPQYLTLVNRTCHSITFQWFSPDDTGRLDVTGYDILHNGAPVATITGTVYTLEGLTPDTVHTISVRTRNAIGSSVLGRKLTRATEQRDKPLMVTAETISSRSIGIGIFPPKPQTGRLHYKCNLTTEGSDSVQMLSLNDTRNNSPYIAVKDLSPYTNYTATCWVLKDGVDQCYIGSDTTQTYTDRPTAPPQEVSIVSTSSHFFTMTWAPPPKGQQNGEIMSYEVEYREEGSNSTVVSTTRGMRYTAEDLTPGRVYRFRVAANTVNGTGPFSEWIGVTIGIIPTVTHTVTNLRLLNTTTSTATITWDQPPHNYRVFLHGEATDNIPQSRIIHLVDVTGQTTHIVEGLNSFRKYSISVYLESDLGQGNSSTVTFQTLGRAPDGSPTHLRATPTSRSVTLQWSSPPVLSRNGILTHYVVGLANETWNTTQSHSITGEQRKRREADSEGVGEETQSLTVEHLRPFTNYTWEVAAVSGFGTGPTSDRRRFETDQDVPTQVESIQVNFTHKTITWAAPTEPNGIIVGYRVQYWELGRRDITEEVNTTAAGELVFSYNNFSAGVPHKVQVQAATVAGLGKSRVVEEVLFSEEQAPAVPVTDITVTQVNDTAVRVTWTVLTLNDARGFPTYVVSVTKEGEQVSSQRTPSASVVVGGLMPHTEYSVTVQALTAGGTKEGPLSEPVTLQKIPFVQPEPTPEQSATAATIGSFVGGTVFGVLATLLVVGIVMGAIKLNKKERARKKRSAAVDPCACLAPDAIPMDANPCYEEVHVYDHIDKKDSKQ